MIAIAIEEELQLSPWVLTGNFHAFRNGHAQLEIAGVGDPSGNGEAHSFTRLRSVRQERGDEKRRRGAGGVPLPARQPSYLDSVELTRKMTKVAAITWLQGHGVEGLTSETTKKLLRADFIAMVREKADELAADADPDGKARFNLPTAQELSELAADIWQRQLAMLSGRCDGADEDLDAVVDDDDDEDMETALLGAMASTDAVDKDYDRSELARLHQGLGDNEGALGHRFGAGGPSAIPSTDGGLPELGAGGVPLATRKEHVLVETSWVKDKLTKVYKRVVVEHRDKGKIQEYRKRVQDEARKQQALQTEQERLAEREQKVLVKRAERGESEAKHRILAAERIRRRQEDGILREKSDGFTMRCTKCGDLGHSKSSRLCPLFGIGEEDPSGGAHLDGVVKQDHGQGQVKLKIHREKFEQERGKLAEVEQQALKAKIDVRKGVQGERDYMEEQFYKHVRGKDRKQEARVGRQAGSALVKLNELLGAIAKEVSQPALAFGDFVRPAVEQAGAFYTRVVEQPMDLLSMAAKAKNSKYRRSSSFREDARLILANVERFNMACNSKLAHLLPIARRLLDAIEQRLSAHADMIAQFDADLLAEDTALPIQRRMRPVSHFPPRDRSSKARRLSAGGSSSAEACGVAPSDGWGTASAGPAAPAASALSAPARRAAISPTPSTPTAGCASAPGTNRSASSECSTEHTGDSDSDADGGSSRQHSPMSGDSASEFDASESVAGDVDDDDDDDDGGFGGDAAGGGARFDDDDDNDALMEESLAAVMDLS